MWTDIEMLLIQANTNLSKYKRNILILVEKRIHCPICSGCRKMIWHIIALLSGSVVVESELEKKYYDDVGTLLTSDLMGDAFQLQC